MSLASKRNGVGVSGKVFRSRRQFLMQSLAAAGVSAFVPDSVAQNDRPSGKTALQAVLEQPRLPQLSAGHDAGHVRDVSAGWAAVRRRAADADDRRDLQGPRVQFYAWFGHSPETEPDLSKLADGLSPEYVYRETKRAVDGAAGRAAVYSGIGLDIPKGGGWGTDVWQSDADEVYRVVRRAFDAGAAGIVASREYEEITTASLRVVGRAVRDVAAKG
jgi:hypothetical protein